MSVICLLCVAIKSFSPTTLQFPREALVESMPPIPVHNPFHQRSARKPNQFDVAALSVGALQQVQHGWEAVPLLLEYYINVSI